MKKFILSLFVLICAFSVSAQNMLYRVQVSAVKQKIDTALFAKVYSFGQLTFEPADNGFTRVFLGSYLTKTTAKEVVKMVKKAGFKQAFVVSEAAVGNYTLSIGDSDRLNVTAYNIYSDEIRQKVYVTYKGGKYHYSLGLYEETDTASETTYENYAAQMKIEAVQSVKVSEKWVAPSKVAPHKPQSKKLSLK